MKSLVRVTAPTIEPVSIEEAMAFLRVDNGDEAPIIEALISTAREVVEDFTGRAMLTQTWRLRFPQWPCSDWYWASRFSAYSNRTVPLERTPVASVESVKYYPDDGGAQTTLSTDTYRTHLDLQPAVIELVDSEYWPALAVRMDAVEVNFTAGATSVDDVPNALRQCVLLLLSHLYENRGAINIGNIVNELPFSLKHLMESQRAGGWIG